MLEDEVEGHVDCVVYRPVGSVGELQLYNLHKEHKIPVEYSAFRHHIISLCKARNLCLYVGMFALRISQKTFIQSTSYLADVLLGTQGSAVVSVKFFG